MSPEQLAQFNDMMERLKKLERVENVAFIKSLERRLEIPSRLSDLDDVEDTDGATTGQVLKKTATTWQPGTDNTGA